MKTYVLEFTCSAIIMLEDDEDIDSALDPIYAVIVDPSDRVEHDSTHIDVIGVDYHTT